MPTEPIGADWVRENGAAAIVGDHIRVVVVVAEAEEGLSLVRSWDRLRRYSCDIGLAFVRTALVRGV